jgi:hypothetical protein
MLASDFTKSKIKDAINKMPSVKAPGPDGFMGLFSKNVGILLKGYHERSHCFPPTAHLQFSHT